eukprot:Polyplicarium_translucidae@DN523_c0_g1_i2.p1
MASKKQSQLVVCSSKNLLVPCGVLVELGLHKKSEPVTIFRNAVLFRLLVNYLKVGDIPSTFPPSLRSEFEHFSVEWPPRQCTRCGRPYDPERTKSRFEFGNNNSPFICSYHRLPPAADPEDPTRRIHPCCQQALGSQSCTKERFHHNGCFPETEDEPGGCVTEARAPDDACCLQCETCENRGTCRKSPHADRISAESQQVDDKDDGDSSLSGDRCSAASPQQRDRHADYNGGGSFYKTKWCKYYLRLGYCSKRDACLFAHSCRELRLPPDLSKTSMCEMFKMGFCKKKNCFFAHNLDELRSTKTFFKTELCAFWLAGHCRAGDTCRHAHGEEELRPKRISPQRFLPSDDASTCDEYADFAGVLSSRHPVPSTEPPDTPSLGSPASNKLTRSPNSRRRDLPTNPPPSTLPSLSSAASETTAPLRVETPIWGTASHAASSYVMYGQPDPGGAQAREDSPAVPSQYVMYGQQDPGVVQPGQGISAEQAATVGQLMLLQSAVHHPLLQRPFGPGIYAPHFPGLLYVPVPVQMLGGGEAHGTSVQQRDRHADYNGGGSFYKTKWCKYYLRLGYCSKRDACLFAHSCRELRLPPDLSKTSMCEMFKMGFCKKKNCFFAHNLDELRSTKTFFKTELCAFWLAGHCRAGDTCRHAHGEEELRPKRISPQRFLPSDDASTCDEYADFAGVLSSRHPVPSTEPPDTPSLGSPASNKLTRSPNSRRRDLPTNPPPSTLPSLSSAASETTAPLR